METLPSVAHRRSEGAKQEKPPCCCEKRRSHVAAATSCCLGFVENKEQLDSVGYLSERGISSPCDKGCVRKHPTWNQAVTHMFSLSQSFLRSAPSVIDSWG